MSIQALWTAVFADTADTAHFAGVIVLRNGHVYGGDNNYHYQGHYRETEGRLEVTLSGTHFHGGRNHIGGDRDAFTLEVAGTADEQAMDLAGHLDDEPGTGVTLHLRRAAELPEVGPSTV